MSNEKYEEFRESGYKSYEDTAKVISYFCKSSEKDPPITGKIFKVPEINFNKNVDINKAFNAIKSRMCTKKGALRKSFENLPPHEVYDWSALLHYLRKEYKDGKKTVDISYKEYRMLFE